jgi:hypothetical protein
MNNNVLSVGDAGAMLMGAGLTQITTNLNIGLILVGVGVFLKVLVAVLQKYDIPVSAQPLG